MNERKRSRLAGWGDYVTSTISVMLVLFILGLVGAINITFHGINRQIKEKMGFTVVLSDSISVSEIESLKNICESAPYVSGYKYLSADDVMAQETNGDGSDLIDLLGVNPYAPMIEINMREDYANVDSILSLTAVWEAMPEVEEATANTEMIGSLNRNARLLNLILLVIAGALLLISFVLINNTVRLTVYSRRFLIHTMKLVGATGAFIRRPFLWINFWQGIIAGLLATGLLVGLVGWASSWEEIYVTLYLPWQSVGVISAGMVCIGVIICVIAAFFATNRYLRKNYDEMFG
ncbi:MAG: cell division protein FtsX [Bacteroidales bacterium]|nr:cell division protein FtsX [Bacteroidales bacterium]